VVVLGLVWNVQCHLDLLLDLQKKKKKKKTPGFEFFDVV
jgi:hypothetical protein